MSFDINPPSRNLSNVQASHQTSEGGAGNTGYFQREKKEDDDIKLRFKEDRGDSFEKQSAEKEEETEFSFLDLILNFFSSIVELIKKPFVKENSKKD